MSSDRPHALYTEPPRFAKARTAIRKLSDPANLALLPVVIGSLAIVAADANPRLAAVLALTAVALVASRLRHAVVLAALLLTVFAVAGLLHVPAITVPPLTPPRVGGGGTDRSKEALCLKDSPHPVNYA